MGGQMAPNAGSNGQRMLTVHHLHVQHPTAVKDAEITRFLKALDQLLHVREGGPSQVKITQRSQAQLNQAKTQANPLSISRPFKETTIEQGHDDAMGRCFMQPCGLCDLGYTSFSMLTVKS